MGHWRGGSGGRRRCPEGWRRTGREARSGRAVRHAQDADLPEHAQGAVVGRSTSSGRRPSAASLTRAPGPVGLGPGEPWTPDGTVGIARLLHLDDGPVRYVSPLGVVVRAGALCRPSRSTTSPTTHTAGGRTPSSGIARGRSASVVRIVRWVGVEPSQTIATGVSGDRPFSTRAAAIAGAVSTPMSTTTVPRSRAIAAQSTSDVGMPRRQVAGDDDELVGEAAVGHRDAGQRGDGDRAGDARAPPPPARPAATHASSSSMPRPKTNGSPPLSRTTRLPASARSTRSALICSCAIDRPRGSLEASMTSTSVGSEASSDSGARWSATTTSACASAWRPRTVISPGSPGPPPTSTTLPGGRPAAARPGPVGDAAVGEPGDDGVADADRPLRVAAAVHADDQVAVPADGGGPRAGGGPVVGAGAEDAVALGLLGDRGVHRRVVGGGDDVPGADEVAGRVAAADPGQRPGLDERLQGRGDLGADDGDARAGLQQPGHAAVGHLPAAHHDDAPAGSRRPTG